MVAEQSSQQARPIRVALSNDYELALLGVAQMLARFPEQVQVVDLTTRPDMTHHHPDVILYDTFGRVPQDDPKLRKIIAMNSAKVVVYSWEQYPGEEALRLGAAGYLHKGLGAAELVAAIVAVHSGQRPTPAAKDQTQIHTWPGQHLGLSQREAEMLSFITRGLTNEEIAARSYLSVNTVKTYIRTAYAKIGVRTRAQCVAWGFRNGFESTDDTGL
jgi:two-component system, NarL family, response regulator LiaR